MTASKTLGLLALACTLLPASACGSNNTGESERQAAFEPSPSQTAKTETPATSGQKMKLRVEPISTDENRNAGYFTPLKSTGSIDELIAISKKLKEESGDAFHVHVGAAEAPRRSIRRKRFCLRSIRRCPMRGFSSRRRKTDGLISKNEYSP